MALTDLRVELRCRNNVLWHAIFDVAGSVNAFCRHHRLQPTEVGRLLNLSMSPYLSSTGDLAALPRRLCALTGLGRDVLWPPHLYSGVLPQGAVAEVSGLLLVSLREARHLALPAAQEDAQITEELKENVQVVLNTLPPRQAYVIASLFGLTADETPRTKVEIAADLCISAARVQQIETRALRKLRHPSRSRALRPFLGRAT